MKQYDSYEPLPGLHVIGKNTLGEIVRLLLRKMDITTLVGLNWNAFTANGKAFPVA